MSVRLRYAPSPTGYLHIGNARTALFNYLFAKHYGGEFIIRIEDTDVSRNIEGGEKSQLDNLSWLGIKWDESIDKVGSYGPYSQLERVKEGIYNKYVDILLNSEKAYKCYCTSEELEESAEKQKQSGLIPKYNGKCRNLTTERKAELESSGLEYSVRFKVDVSQVYEWEDIVKNNVSFLGKDVSGDFNILKRDGIPTYNFAVVIDDHLMAISHVLRGEDHISNTPKQIMIYDALNFEKPIFGHMTLIVNAEGKKLSKRDKSIVQFIEEYKDLGYLPDAMFNFIALLGWSPGSEKEIFDIESLINIFDENRLSTSSAKFDINKLTWINNQYIKKMSDIDYLNLVEPFLVESNVTKETLDKICLLYKDQLNYGKEIVELTSMFYNEVNSIEEESLNFIKQEGVKNTIEVFKELLINHETDITAEVIKSLIKNTGKNAEVKGKMLFMPIRIATTGQEHGPDLAESLEILGKEIILKNLNYILSKI